MNFQNCLGWYFKFSLRDLSQRNLSDLVVVMMMMMMMVVPTATTTCNL
jgi:hypothetical protein